MKRPLLAALIVAVLLPLAIDAKRAVIPEVPPVTFEGITYKAPHDNGRIGYIEAYDASTGNKLWKKTIFRIFIWPFMEEDVQWVFITELRIENNKLVIVDENGKTYSLRLKKASKARAPA